MHTLKKLQSKLLTSGFFIFLKQLRMEREEEVWGEVCPFNKAVKKCFLLGNTYHLPKNALFPDPVRLKTEIHSFLNLLFHKNAEARV